ncbi:hypothetical protein NEAUS04_1460 [Nematocida ausubeli]|uniref:Uncharacterized protein n=1 Tax=Nematocida ausubeli (strain ATCC PRA-371 / ERTm2) TaxID=1913371 RepID=A0A086J4J2_NEMA1|nr:uncharacterized protein NESG_00133 [Nematocida ausubeli]KAI5135874.1 hypothetical protein NEAUS07_1392 [Nematocida ausubeli]KAI5149094.1 hypothetical protein NEAUS05_1638 [Nematocida ausubeli]KAI5163275.1 hypothetical protein NEAUS04_1460 [Nematocida ausubeli]KFG27060.1 hypothetical protein NESG_00133 [Nematocida ausubeli]
MRECVNICFNCFTNALCARLKVFNARKQRMQKIYIMRWESLHLQAGKPVAICPNSVLLYYFSVVCTIVWHTESSEIEMCIFWQNRKEYANFTSLFIPQVLVSFCHLCSRIAFLPILSTPDHCLHQQTYTLWKRQESLQPY